MFLTLAFFVHLFLYVNFRYSFSSSIKNTVDILTGVSLSL